MASPIGHPPYNKNGEGGRPRIYTKEFVDNEASILEEWLNEKGIDNVFAEDFCLERGYHTGRIDEFIKISDRFALAYKFLKMKQKMELIKGGLKRKYAHPMCALTLSANHNMYLKSEQTLSGDAANPLGCIISIINGTSKDLVSQE